jgi:hypothetical protein
MITQGRGILRDDVITKSGSSLMKPEDYKAQSRGALFELTSPWKPQILQLYAMLLI